MTISTDQREGVPTLTPIRLDEPRLMRDVVHGVTYLQHVDVGGHKLLALLDHGGRVKAVYGDRRAGIPDAFELVHLARKADLQHALSTRLLAELGYRLMDGAE